MKRIIQLFLVWISFQMIFDPSVQGQSVLMEENVLEDTIPRTLGPNYDNFWHTYIRYGFMAGAPENESAAIKYFNSYELALGFRYKRRIASFYALGFNLDYSQQSFHLKQDSSKLTPDSILHKRERLQFNYVNLEFYNRFNFGKRGNIVGRYLDLGVYGGYGFAIVHHTRDKYDAALFGAEIVDVVNRKLNYIEKINYGGSVRIGFNKFALYAKYRASDLFNDTRALNEMPRLIFGIELGMFR